MDNNLAEDRPIFSLSTAEFMKVLNSQISTAVRTEVATAVGPIEASQQAIVTELKNTNSKVTELVSDNVTTKNKVEELQNQLHAMKQHLDGVQPVHPVVTVPLSPPHSLCPTAHSSSLNSSRNSSKVSVHSDDDTAAVDAIRHAKKVLGFSPINTEDISYLMKKHSIADDQEAMKLAIIEFLNLEMKVPTAFTDQLSIKRVFPPARQSSGWKILYAEFQDSSCTDVINQYVTNLQPGRSVNIYVPHSLFPRFSSIRDIEHSYRNGDIKHKTRIKYGVSDFVLLVKPRNTQVPWTYVPLTSILPPLKLSGFDGNPSSSPPPGRSRSASPPAGRPRLSSKRSRNDSNDSENIRQSKTRFDNDENQTNENVASPNPSVNPSPSLDFSSNQATSDTTKTSSSQSSINLN